MVESFFLIFRNEIFGEEMTEKGESMEKVGRKSICVFWYIINDIVTTCRLNHNNNKENRYPKERKKEKEERKEISKSCCGYKRHTCLKEGWKVCISSMKRQRLKISRNPSNWQILRIFEGTRFRKYTLYPFFIILFHSLFTKPYIIADYKLSIPKELI